MNTQLKITVFNEHDVPIGVHWFGKHIDPVDVGASVWATYLRKQVSIGRIQAEFVVPNTANL